MNRGNLRKIARSLVPGAKIAMVSNETVNLLMEAGILDIATHAICLPTNKKFTVTADKDEYSLSSVIGDFLVVDKPGLWWNAGTATDPDWQEVYPKTIKLMDRDRPSWRDDDSDEPLDYFIKGDILTIKPTPDTTLADGAWLYYGKRPTIMTKDSHFPFTGATEWDHLSVFDEAITTYLEWKLGKIVAKGKNVAGGVTHKDYEAVRAQRTALFNRRPDIAAHRKTKLQGPKVGKC